MLSGLTPGPNGWSLSVAEIRVGSGGEIPWPCAVALWGAGWSEAILIGLVGRERMGIVDGAAGVVAVSDWGRSWDRGGEIVDEEVSIVAED